MNGMKAETFNYDYQLVKAMTTGYDNDTIVIGYYYCLHDTDNEKKYIPYVKPKSEEIFYEVNPYTVCRNSGIRDSKGNYVYEYDLLKLKSGLKADGYGFLVWEDFYKAWKIRRYTEFGGCSDVGNYQIEAIGNIILYDADAEIIFKQNRQANECETVYDTSYCPSCFKK